MLRTLGKRVAGRRGLLGASIAGGAALGVAQTNPLKNTVSASMDFVFGDENADNVIMGRDIGFSSLFPIVPQFDWMPAVPDIVPEYLELGNWAHGINMMRKNPQIARDAFTGGKTPYDRTFAAAMRNVDQGYTDTPYVNSIYPYNPGTRRTGVAASGDMIFGMYNTRMGG